MSICPFLVDITLEAPNALTVAVAHERIGNDLVRLEVHRRGRDGSLFVHYGAGEEVPEDLKREIELEVLHFYHVEEDRHRAGEDRK